MTEEENLLKKVDELKKDLEKKDNEMIRYIDKIDNLEEELMKLHELMAEEPSKKKSKKLKESKFQNELVAKDREIRELKDKMGFLRKDKLEAQKELENIKSQEKFSSVIRVEELREKAPLNILVKELQGKINKQESLLRRLRNQNVGRSDFSETIKNKNEEIKSLEIKITELEQKIEKIESNSAINIKSTVKESSSNISKALLEDLQNRLNKTKRENNELRKKLKRYKDKGKLDKKIKKFEITISELTSNLEKKENEISKLREEKVIKVDTSEPTALEQVVEELKNKLNKSKSQILILQEQLKSIGDEKAVTGTIPQNDIDSQLKIQREMASFLQQQLDEANSAVNTKNEEITTIKNEAIKIKRSYEELENQVRLKDKKISELMADVDKLSFLAESHTQAQNIEDPQLILRIEELKNIIEDLTKQNIQQRLEIDQLRKNL
jgi:chromosome segregation ATPase